MLYRKTAAVNVGAGMRCLVAYHFLAPLACAARYTDDIHACWLCVEIDSGLSFATTLCHQLAIEVYYLPLECLACGVVYLQRALHVGGEYLHVAVVASVGIEDIEDLKADFASAINSTAE